MLNPLHVWPTSCEEPEKYKRHNFSEKLMDGPQSTLQNVHAFFMAKNYQDCIHSHIITCHRVLPEHIIPGPAWSEVRETEQQQQQLLVKEGSSNSSNSNSSSSNEKSSQESHLLPPSPSSMHPRSNLQGLLGPR